MEYNGYLIKLRFPGNHVSRYQDDYVQWQTSQS